MNNKRREYQWRTAVLMFGFGVIAALASSALLVTVYAQPESQRDSASDRITVSNKRSEKARPFGASGSKVTLQLTFDTGAVFTVTQFEDAPIRVQQNDSTVAIAAHIDADNQVTADIFVGFSADSQDLSIKGRRPEISSFAIGRDEMRLIFMAVALL